jgi:hypothetical protein
MLSRLIRARTVEHELTTSKGEAPAGRRAEMQIRLGSPGVAPDR